MVDIHAHLTLLPFNRGEDLWYHCPVGLNEEGDDLPKFTQSDLISAYHGRVNVIVYALYPLEKGFFDPKYLGRGKLADFAINKVSRIPYERIDNVQEDKHQYFEDLQNEYQLLLNASKELILKNGDKVEYALIDSYEDLSNYLSIDEEFNVRGERGKIAIINSIEGGHALGIGELHQDNGEIDADIWVKSIVVQLLNIMRVLAAEGFSHADSWKYVSIGTDFDGMINPLDAYPSYAYMDEFVAHLYEGVMHIKQEEIRLQHYSEEDLYEIAEGVSFKNALRFLKRVW